VSVLLPLKTDATPHYSFGVTLDGVAYTFEFRWNDRGEFWVFDIADGSGNPLVSGRKVVVDFPLLGRFAVEGLPEGSLFAVDTSGAGQGPTLEDFGARVTMVYLTAEEMAAES
jgi:hypothetical protein